MDRRRFLSLSVSGLAISFAVPQSTFAQWYRRYRRVDVDDSIRRAERTSDEFVKVFDRNLDDSVLDDSEREDKLNEKARDLEGRLDRLRKDFDDRPNWWEAREAASEALQYAKGINNSVRRRRYTYECEQMWVRLRDDLNRIARYFNLPRLPR